MTRPAAWRRALRCASAPSAWTWESARRTTELEFDGYGIGGLSVGETRAEMLPALASALEHLPADRPRLRKVERTGVGREPHLDFLILLPRGVSLERVL